MRILGKFLVCLVLIYHTAAYAGLPTPSDDFYAGNGKSWLDVGNGLVTKSIGYVAIALSGMIFLGVTASIYRAYHIALEKQDLMHFFKVAVCGLVVIMIAIGFTYFAVQVAA